MTNTYITLGPWRFTIPVKKEQAIEDMEPKWVVDRPLGASRPNGGVRLAIHILLW